MQPDIQSPSTQPPRRSPDVRRRALTLTTAATALLGLAIAAAPARLSIPAIPSIAFGELLDVRPVVRADRDAELRGRFEQGVVMLHMRQYEYAATAFHQVLTIAPQMPEAHVNMGFALLGLEQWQAARSFFETAIELRREQLNAYYGLALALEAQQDVRGAIGAMQTYIHLAPENDGYRERAVAALAGWRGQTSQSTMSNNDLDTKAGAATHPPSHP